MASANNMDRDLLLGHIAVELNFINTVTFEAAKEAWLAQKHQSMGQVLVDRQAISPHTRDVLENLVQLQLAQDGSDEKDAAADPHITLTGVVDDLISPHTPPPIDASFSGPLANAAAFRFRKLKPLAAGALGQVYVARDRELHRKVALKEIQDRWADLADSRSRFLLEAEITGRLEHPGVVPVYGLGRYDNGRPFYAMRFIKGESLAEAIKDLHRPELGELTPGARTLELRNLLGRFVAVCNTMQYAHDRKIVHRDLKPGNIMLGEYGETLVVDWGLAKVVGGGLISDPSGSLFEPLPTSGSSETLPGRAIGTITYMSPEQAAGRLDQVGPASDVYSLGATLFSILTGRASVEDSLSPDQRNVDLRKLQKKVINGDLHRPRDLNPGIDPALEAICSKAMALKIEDRYLSARALAEDLEKWLANEPVSAWPEPVTVRARRWLGRHRTFVSGMAAALLVGIVSLAAATLLLNDERHKLQTQILATDAANKGREEALKKAEDERNTADHERLEAVKQRGEAVKARDDLVSANQLLASVNSDLASANEKLAKSTTNLIEARNKADAARMQAETDRAAAVKSRDLAAYTLALNTTMLAQSRWNEGQVVLAHDALEQVPGKFRFAGWHALRRQFEGSYATLYGHVTPVRRVSFGPDGKWLASLSKDGKTILWDARTGRHVRDLAGGTALAFSPDGKRLALGTKDGTLKLFDPATGALLNTAARHHDEEITCLAVSPDGKRLLSASMDGKLKSCDALKLDTPMPFPRAHATGVTSVSFSPDGKRVASTSLDKTLIVWDATTGADLQTFMRRTNGIAGASFSPGGRLLAAVDPDETVKLYHVDTGDELPFTGRMNAGVTQVLFSPEGRRLAASSWDGTINVWELGAPRKPITLQGHVKETLGITFSPDGQRLASASADWTVKLWDLAGAPELRTFAGSLASISSVAYSPGPTPRIAAGSWNGVISVWNADSGAALWSLKAHPSEVLSVAFNSDGTRLASAGQDSKIKLWDADTGKEIAAPIKAHAAAVTSVAFSKDGKRLASASKDRTVRVWNLADGAEVRAFKCEGAEPTSVAFSPDGTRLAWADRGGTVKIGDIAAGTVVLAIDAHASGITRLAYGPLGDCLASAGQDGRVNLWDPHKSLPPLLSLKGHAGGVMGIAFSADGKRLVSAGKDGAVKIWDVRTGQDVRTLHGHADLVTSVAFSPDGTRIASGSLDRTVKLWDATTATELHTFKGKHARPIVGVGFSADGKRLVSLDEQDRRVVWDAGTGQAVPEDALSKAASPISPDGKKLALPFASWFYVVDLAPTPAELKDRETMSRVKVWWHVERALRFEKQPHWYAAAFHWSWAASASPTTPKHWKRLDESCRHLKSHQLALEACTRVLRAHPDWQPKWPPDAPTWFDFLFAQAHHRLGNPAAARRFYDAARLPEGATPEARQVFETLRANAATELGVK